MLICRGVFDCGVVMRIELEKLGKNGANFAHDYKLDEMSLDQEGVRLPKPPSLKGRIDRNGRHVQVKGVITAEAEVDCARCLKPINVPVDAEFDVRYVAATDYATLETPELNVEDLNVSVFQDDAIDFDDLAREQILLALPSRLLCRQDCRGLCPVCGINKNVQACQCEPTLVDPRWAALKDLRS
jgi:uncharacterized protein